MNKIIEKLVLHLTNINPLFCITISDRYVWNYYLYSIQKLINLKS